jgi:hypothetical protein
MHTLTIGLGAQTAAHLQFSTFSEAKIAYDRVYAAWTGDAAVHQLKDDFHQELTVDLAEVTHVLLQDMRKTMEAAVALHKLQQQAQAAAQGGIAHPASILPFGRSQ